MGMIQEFKEFAMKGNVVDLAIGVVIGGAFGKIVSSLIDDLIQTTESFKAAKDEINQLNEQKEAWELVVEPYKCDNSRLLSECNKLKLDLLNNEKKVQIENSGKISYFSRYFWKNKF